MNTPEENKAVALSWIEASVAGDVDAVRRLFAADCAILVAGDMPFCEWMDVDAFFNQTMILPLDGEIIFEEIGRAPCRESVSVRVDLGGRRIIKKKKRHSV